VGADPSRRLSVVFDVDALDDLRSARAWYNGESPGVGDRLTSVLRKKLEQISDAPRSFPADPLAPPARIARRARFPYAIVYLIEPSALVVIAIAHLKRDPGYYARRAARKTP
jgi:plasmid stabilization system protein ParE